MSSSPGMRDGIFLPSEARNAMWPQTIALGTLIGLLALLGAAAVTTLCLRFELGKLWPPPPWVSKKATARGIVALMLLLPLWGWGAERGFIRIWAHNNAPTLGQVTTMAIVSSHYQTMGGRRSSGPWEKLTVRIPPYGRVTFTIRPERLQGLQFEKGTEIPISGRRTGLVSTTTHWNCHPLRPQTSARRKAGS
ncbi:hypothetical protein N8D56_10505 [Devosia sp. A8/3-2]|nr:hypothetical protein N8D56_10505 [Devosia sp. A8/3-2]